MKTGKTIVELAKTLQDIKDNAKDFLVPTGKLSMKEDGSLAFANGQTHAVAPNTHAHGQVASYAGVPKMYYDRLLGENRALLAKNVNHGFQKQAETVTRSGKPETRMLRTYKGGARAMLSSSYRRLDSYDLCKEILPVLTDNRFEIVSSEITDTRMYLKAMTPKVTAEIKKGDMVQYGLVISNSDVGAGSVRVEPLVLRLVCLNGMISNTAIKKFHLGKNMAGDDIQELLTEETQHLTDKAFWMQVRDIVRASMEPKNFEMEVDRLRAAAGQKITNFDLPDVVELAMKSVNVDGEGTKDNIVAYLANGADGAGLTKWGLINGFTWAAQQPTVSYDRSIELERAGAKILDLSQNQWRRVAEVA